MPRGRKKATTTISKSKNDTKSKTKPLHKQFEADDLVWIRMGKYPWWPACVKTFLYNSSFKINANRFSKGL